MNQIYKKVKQKLYKLIDILEDFFETDMRYLIKNTSWLSFSSVIDSGTSFIMAIAFANLIPKDIYGSYQYVSSVVGFLAVFSLTSLGGSITRSVAKGFEGVLKASLKVKLKWGVLSLLGGLCVSGYYFFNDNLTLATAFLIPAFLFPIQKAFEMYGPFLRGKKNFSLVAKSRIIKQVIATSLLVGVLFYADSLIWLLLSYYGIWAILAVFFFFYVEKRVERNDKREKDVMTYGKHLSAMGIISRLSSTMEDVLLWHFVGPVALATYSFGVKPAKEIRGFLFKNIRTIAFPKFSDNDMETLRKTLPSKVLKTFFILVPVILLYILAAPYLYKIFFPKYVDAVLISQIFVLTLLFKPKVFLNQVLKAQKKTRAKYVISITVSVVEIIALILLIPLYGIWGLLTAIFIKEIYQTGVLCYYFLKS